MCVPPAAHAQDGAQHDRDQALLWALTMRVPTHQEEMEKGEANIARNGTIARPQEKLCGAQMPTLKTALVLR